ncbi:MAG: AAA family ATPase [Promethearchaeota archaeon]
MASSEIKHEKYKKSTIELHRKPDPDEKIFESYMGTKHLIHNVIHPSGDEQEYFPMLEFKTGGGISLNELDIIKKAVERDRQDRKKYVTIVYFISPPGLGKTVMGGHLASYYNCPYQIINCVSSMTDLDLLGAHILIEQETIWQDGPLPSIIRATNSNKIGILLLNELNALTLSAQIALNPLFDKQRCVILTLNNNERVKISEGSHLLILATMNPNILGVNELQDSIRDRSHLVIEMPYPTIEKEAYLMYKLTGISVNTSQKFAAVIHECRLLKTRDFQITKAPSTRGLLYWMNYSAVWGTEIAFELAIVNKYGTSEDEQKALRLIGKGKDISSIKLFDEPPKKTVKSSESKSDDFESLQKQAYELYKQGKKVSEIIKIIGRSKTTIYRYLRNEKRKYKDKMPRKQHLTKIHEVIKDECSS